MQWATAQNSHFCAEQMMRLFSLDWRVYPYATCDLNKSHIFSRNNAPHL
jgi:hypothetical protein